MCLPEASPGAWLHGMQTLPPTPSQHSGGQSISPAVGVHVSAQPHTLLIAVVPPSFTSQPGLASTGLAIYVANSGGAHVDIGPIQEATH